MKSSLTVLVARVAQSFARPITTSLLAYHATSSPSRHSLPWGSIFIGVFAIVACGGYAAAYAWMRRPSFGEDKEGASNEQDPSKQA